MQSGGALLRSALAALTAASSATGAGCVSHDVPEHPTWADVQPIVAGSCVQCHGANAGTVASGYRFDFFDMTSDVCGEAADALDPGASLAKALAAEIGTAITSSAPDIRPSMPPLPAPYLSDWEWQTLLRWSADPQRGTPLTGNSPPTIRTYQSQISGAAGTAKTPQSSLDLTAVLEDPEGDPIVGVLRLAGPSVQLVLKMDHGGSFSAHLDTSSWPAGAVNISAVLCDGWSSVKYELGAVTISAIK